MADKNLIAIPLDVSDQTATKRCLSLIRDEVVNLNTRLDSLSENLRIEPVKNLVLEPSDLVSAVSQLQAKINEIIDALNKAHTI